MAITTLAQYLAASKQRVRWIKTASRSATALQPISVFDLAGSPGAGALAIDWATHQGGIVPVGGDAGYPQLAPFASGAAGCISRVDYAGTVACWLDLYDRLYVVGTFGGDTLSYAVSSPASYASRVPGGTDFTGLQLFVESVALGGAAGFTITYTNQDGVTGCTTGLVQPAAAIAVGGCLQTPLAPGDTGVQAIESITLVWPTATFESDVVGAVPSGWAATINSDFVVASDGGDNWVKHASASGEYAILVWTAQGQIADVDVKAKIKFTESTLTEGSLMVRANGAATWETTTAYHVQFTPYDNSVRLYEVIAGTETQLGSTISFAQDVNIEYWVRLQAIGTALKVRVWAAANTEPATWDLEVTNSDVSAAGYVGLKGYSSPATLYDLVTLMGANQSLNAMVLRPLWSGLVPGVNTGNVHQYLRTGLVEVFDDSALYGVVTPVGAASGIPTMTIEVASG